MTENRKNSIISFILCLFLGYLGIHKFYEKNIKMGIIYLLSFGLFGFGWFADTLVLFVKIFKQNSDIYVNATSSSYDNDYRLGTNTNYYDRTRESDLKNNIDYQKKSSIVSIFTKKWYDICCKEFVVLDFETTGLDKVYDNIVEIAAIRYVDGIEKEKYVTLVNPLRPIPADASAVHHITNNMVKSAPKEKEAIPLLINFIENSIIVGHNVNFDIGFLEIAAQRCGMSVKYSYIDTLSISKKLFPDLPDYKLGTIASSLGIDTTKLHRAEADVYVCSEIIKIAIDTLSVDFESVSKEIKSVKTTHRVKRIDNVNTSATQSLERDGMLRKSLGEHLVIVSCHDGSCDNYKKFENKVLIDDVYSGGSKKDGNYMLLSEAMEQGLFHEGCRHGLGTYYPDLKDITRY